MGSSGISNNANKYSNTKPSETDIKNENLKKNEALKITEINQRNNRKQECIIEMSPFENIDSHLTNVSKSICKLKIQTSNQIIRGTGFLLRFNINQESFYCLMSNEHVIRKDIINNNNIINISYDSEFRFVNIKLDSNKRYIKCFKDIGLDITVVEILDEDNISKDYFLWNEIEIIG